MTKIVLRNIFRNRRRSLLSLLIIGLGAAMLFLISGFITDSLGSMEKGLVGGYGHLQVADPGYWDRSEEPKDYLIGPEKLEQVEQVLEDHRPQVESWTRELDFSGLVGNAERTAMIIGSSIEVGNPTIDPIDPLLVSGHPLNEDQPKEILLGRRLAERLDVEPGDRINVAGFTVTESLNAMTVRVAGVFWFHTVQWEEQLTFVPLELAQRLLRTAGVDKIVIRLSGMELVPTTATALQNRFDEVGLDLEVRIWEEIAPFYSGMKTFWDALYSLSVVGVFILAFFGIMQVLTMSFMERTREVGTIRAIGTERRQVFRIFLSEGLLLGSFGGLLGVVLGLGLGGLINISDIGWMYPGATEPMPVAIQLQLGNAVVPFLVALLSAFLSALYPAAHAARTNIVEALHYV